MTPPLAIPSTPAAALDRLQDQIANPDGQEFHALLVRLWTAPRAQAPSPAQLAQAARLALARAWRWDEGDALGHIVPDPAIPAPTRAYWNALVAAARFDEARADTILVNAAARWPHASLDFLAERTLLRVRFGRWGLAAAELRAIDPVALSGRYRPLAETKAIVESLPPPDRQATYPDYVIDALLDAAPAPYAARSDTLVTIVQSLAAAGTERQVVAVTRALAAAGIVEKHSLLVGAVDGRHGHFLPAIAATGVSVVPWNDDPSATDLEEPLRRAVRALPDDWAQPVHAIAAHLTRLRPAAVQVRQDFLPGLLACRAAGVPRIILHRGTMPPPYWRLTPMQRRRTIDPMRHLYRRLLEGNFTIVDNSLAGRAADRAWLGSDAGRDAQFVHLPNIVDVQAMRATATGADVRAELGIPGNAPLIGAVMRLHSFKRVGLWLKTAATILTRCPHAHFVIAGDGEERDVARDRARALGIADRVHFPGTVANVGDWYRACDVVLLTSYREGLPNMLIEAQGFGRAVVATDVGGVAETFADGETGRLVAADATPGDIAATVIACLEDTAWRAAIAERGPAVVEERFGAARAVATLGALYGFRR